MGSNGEELKSKIHSDLTPEEDEYLWLTRYDFVHDEFRTNNGYVFHDFPKYALTFRNRYPPPQDTSEMNVDLDAIPYRTFEHNPYSPINRCRLVPRNSKQEEPEQKKDNEMEKTGN